MILGGGKKNGRVFGIFFDLFSPLLRFLFAFQTGNSQRFSNPLANLLFFKVCQVAPDLGRIEDLSI